MKNPVAKNLRKFYRMLVQRDMKKAMKKGYIKHKKANNYE